MIKKALKWYFTGFNYTKKVVVGDIVIGIILLPWYLLIGILYAPLYYLAKWLNQ